MMKFKYINIFAYCVFIPLFVSMGNTGNNNVKMKEGYLKGSDNAKIFYRIIGNGQDTIVVVHGGPGAGMNSVFPFIKPLAEKNVLIFYDQRGGGKSELPVDTTKLKPRYFVEDLEAVRKYFNLRKMNIITHSFGSILVAQYGMKYPDKLKRIIFHGSTPPIRSNVIEYYRNKSETSVSVNDTSIVNRMNRILTSLLKDTADDPVKACRAYEEFGKQLAINRGDKINNIGTTCDASPEAVRYYYRYTAQLAPEYFGMWDYTGELDSLISPLMVVYGTNDSLALPLQREWVQIVPNCRFLPVPGAGKSALSDNPEYVIPAINTFFSGKWPKETEGN